MGIKNESKMYPVYPFESIQLTAVFVYGTDFQRELNLFAGISRAIKLIAAFIVLFISLAAIVLHIIRRKLRLPRADLVSTHIDCWIPFIGGGNLEIRHRLERWFFGILLFAAFFIMSVFSGDLLDSVVKVYNQKIGTFEELAEINAPIYIEPTLGFYSDTIHEMLKCVNKCER